MMLNILTKYMVKYKSRVGAALKKANVPTKTTASKVLERKPATKEVAKRVAPVVKRAVQAVRERRSLGAAIPVGGVIPASPHGEPISEAAIDQLDPHVFIHMMNNMDMPTHQMLKGIASNFLGIEHPLKQITRGALGGDFTFPKNLSKIAMRDIIKAKSPQELAGALHSEWLDMMSGKLSAEEMGGGLFSSLKTLVKKGVKGARTALKALGKGAATAVRAVSAGAKGAQHIGKSVSNALMQGIEVANALSPIIQEVFPQTEGVLKAGLGKANAANELLKRGIDIAARTEKAVEPGVRFAELLGDIGDPIIVQMPQEEVGAGLTVGGDLPQGQGLDLSNAEREGSEISGPRFVS